MDTPADVSLRDLITRAAAGSFPAADGTISALPGWRPGLCAVVAFTGHAILVSDVPAHRDRWFSASASPVADGFGGAHDPRLMSELAGRDGWIDSLDVLLVGRGTGGAGVAADSTPLVERPDLDGHPRAGFARRVRDDIRLLGRPEPGVHDVVVLARGVGGLTEISVETVPSRAGAGRVLIRDALATVAADQIVVAAVAPGNATSLRAFLAAGFAPIGSMQLFRPE